MSKDAMDWDLSSLYDGPEDPRWEAYLAAAGELAEAFRGEFRGRIASEDLTPQHLATALGRFEALQRRGLKPLLYAQLLFSGDSTPDRHRALLARAREAWSEATETVLFFELEILRIEGERFAALLADPAVAPYAHYLDNARAHAPYTLSEEVEQALQRKDLTGKQAFVQLFEELSSSLRYLFTLPGEEEPREVTGEELLALLHHPDGGTRETAFATFLEKHAENALVLSSCFNNIFLDHGKEVDLRGYPDLMTPTHLASETEPEMVERMMETAEANYGLAREYFGLKRRLLGLETFKNTDIYAPVEEEGRTFTYAEARDLVLEAFGGFAPEMALAAEGFFAERRIDVPPRPGKTGGAFCMPMMPGLAPYVLLNFTGTPRDVSTLAHELGHGIHNTLAQGQNFFHYYPSLPMAETASVFGEMLLTRHLLQREEDRGVKIALLCAKLEDIIATTFRQNVLTRFELAAHKKRAGGLLSADDFCRLWQEENARLFGDAVEMIPSYRWGWSYIGHFIHSRFYCYSYVFGELLVLALYQKYLEEGASFVPKYLDLLRLGGSRPPQEGLRPLGIDLTDPGFWQKGFDFTRSLLEELKALASGPA
ncbi:MAG: oligoendopeptidase F [Desulfuromonas sp.]|uniref:M3 family oligoendopeptidase n=1 Tax=Desulfuromonas sp. TaxID=892 RepID=UPI000CC7F67A|nr:M3 family oligoendopeptidase [Desulfuromonas sp.]PLX83178.1 MAG: oligoendopeptidase F [Desulfuromonas sp.]